jgi:hypothetical protein
MGPDFRGPPQTPPTATSGTGWVDNPVLGGNPNFGNPIAGGPQSGLSATGTATTVTIVPQVVDAETLGNETEPPKTQDEIVGYRISWYDLGANGGRFVTDLASYRDWMINDIPDTNLVLNIQQSQRSEYTQATNSNATECMLSVPIRLNLGTNTGTLQYVESVEALLSSSTEYWEHRFINPLASLYKLNVSFSTYNGTPIPLEKMLQTRRSVQLLNNFSRIFGTNFSFKNINPRSIALAFVFDPVNPQLEGRVRRTFGITFNVQTYEYESPGLYMGMLRDMLDKEVQEEEEPFIVRASNYSQYS